MLFRKKVSYSITGSKMEALGRSTIEAMLAGNIVIGADTGLSLIHILMKKYISP